MSGSDVDSSRPARPVREEAPRPVRARRWWRWVTLALAFTGAYWIASYGARPLAETWLSKTLGAQVELRRVGFDPIDGVVTLEGLVAHLPDSSSWAAGPIVADRARLDLQWFPLIHRRIQIRELALEAAVLDLDGLADALPGFEAIQASIAPATLPEGWTVQIDRLALRDSLVRIATDEATSVPMVVSVGNAEVIATRRRTGVLGATTNLLLDARFEGGTLHAEGHYALRPEGLVVTADLHAADLPVARLLEPLPRLGLRHLSGRLEGKMRYVLDARRNTLSGWARLRDGRMDVPGRTGPAFEVRNAIADIESVDLDRHSVRIRSLVLRGATLAPEPGVATTLLTSLASDPSARRTDSTGDVPWQWAVEQLDASDARLRFGGPEDPVDVVAQLRGENLGPRSHWSPVDATLSYGSASASFDGSVRTSYDEPRLEGRLVVDGIDLPALAREVELPGAHLVVGGSLTANLDVFLEPSRGGFGVTGWASLDRVAASGTAREAAGPITDAPVPVSAAVAAAAGVARQTMSPQEESFSGEEALLSRALPAPPRTFYVGADRIDLQIHAPAPPRRRTGPAPTQQWILDAGVTRPFLQAARDRDGWLLPSLEPPPDPSLATADGGDARSGASPEATTPPETAITLPPLPVTIRRLSVVDGRILYFDGAAPPLLSFDVRQIHGEALWLRPSPLVAAELWLEGNDDGVGILQLRGFDVSAEAGLELAGEGIALYRAEAYLERLGLPYRFTSGEASFTTALRRDGDEWTTDTVLVLNQPRVEPWSEDEVVPELLGMSMSAALDLLRDQNGDVRVHLPRLTNLHQELGVAIYDAVRHAHESPSSGGALTPTPVEFAPGQTAIPPASVAWLRSVARMVAAHPSLRVELAAPASLQDRRWLAEQDVLRRLQDRGGLMNALSLLGVGDDYAQLRHALEMRARGRAWDLEPYDEENLARLLAEQPPVAEARLRALGAERLENIERLLRVEGVAPGRLTQQAMPGVDRTTLAAVLVTVRAEPHSHPTSIWPAPDGAER